MEINKEDLTEIYLLLKDLDERLLKLEAEKTDAGVVMTGAPKFVKDYIDKIKDGRK